jgi:cyclopropane-fatty-acyl-phospholipid synthase
LSSVRALFSLTRDLLALPSADGDGATVRALRADARVAPAGGKHEPSRDRAAISYHYDVGNDFYQLWLDKRMVYSCAYFHRDDDTLDDAQEAKLDLVCRKLRLEPGDRFLDIGCGWGALVIHAATHYGVNAVGLTLSTRQAELATRRIAEAAFRSCRRVARPRSCRDSLFDKIASVGMVERWIISRVFRGLRRACTGRLPSESRHRECPEGRLRRWRDLRCALWKVDAFIDQYVFPDGKLGPFYEVIHAAEGVGFETRDVESLREHYARTLGEWLKRLEGNHERAVGIVGETEFRVWRLYMTAAQRGFKTGDLNVLQTLLSKPCQGHSNLPPTREDLFT